MTQTYQGTIDYEPDGINGQRMTFHFQSATGNTHKIDLPLCQEQQAYAALKPKTNVEITTSAPFAEITPRRLSPDQLVSIHVIDPAHT